MRILFPVPYSLLTTPCSLFPVPCSLWYIIKLLVILCHCVTEFKSRLRH
ncbi:hypothetical protein [Moorena sp. SIO3I6]|nr:hypothetical protein [Moorena sp. SIO3I6]NEP23531.1 hypothetical protein [Moorena sp. SIO3I6]